MAYDAELAHRVRACLGETPHEEKAMFGGLAFLVGGHMAVAAGGGGGLLVRCDPVDLPEHGATDGVAPMVMRGRPMTGWLHVAPEAVADDDALRHWVAVGLAYVAGLPPKR